LNRKTIRRHLTFWSLWCGLFAGAILIFLLYQARTAMAHRQNDAEIQTISLQLAKQVAVIKQAREEIESLNRQQADLEMVLQPTPFSGILKKFVDIMAGDMWLNVLQIHRQDAGEKERIRLEVTGYASSNATLGNFLNRLSVDPAVTGVVLKYAKEKAPSAETAGKKEGSWIEFDVRFSIYRS
jgi:Tfp pilus assembly protein PilN